MTSLRWVWLALLLHWGTATEITDASLSDLALAEHLLIYFFLDLCRYCREFDPTYGYIEQVVAPLPAVQVVRVDGRANPRLRLLFSVEGFPSLRWLHYPSRKITTLNDRSFDGVVNYIEDQTGVVPDYSRVSRAAPSIEGKDALDVLSEPCVVIITAPWLRGWENYHYPLHPAQEWAQAHPDTPLYIADIADDNQRLLQRLRVSAFPTVIRLTTNRVEVYAPRDIEHFSAFMEGNIDAPWFNNVDEIEVLPDDRFQKSHGLYAHVGEVQGEDDETVYQEETRRVGV